MPANLNPTTRSGVGVQISGEGVQISGQVIALQSGTIIVNQQASGNSLVLSGVGVTLGATTPTITNVRIAASGTQYTANLTAGTKKVLVQGRTGALTMSYTSGKVLWPLSGSVITIGTSKTYWDDLILFSGIVFVTGVSGDVAEVLAWN
jgi:hypothetical protein